MKTKVNTKKKVSTKPKTKALKQGAVSGRLSSYAKMKLKYEASIRQLTDDIITLVEEKDFMKVTIVKMQWRMRLDTEKMIWFGSLPCH
jgi:hypothetical protein